MKNTRRAFWPAVGLAVIWFTVWLMGGSPALVSAFFGCMLFLVTAACLFLELERRKDHKRARVLRDWLRVREQVDAQFPDGR